MPPLQRQPFISSITLQHPDLNITEPQSPVFRSLQRNMSLTKASKGRHRSRRRHDLIYGYS
jgi:hypothetical protein